MRERTPVPFEGGPSPFNISFRSIEDEVLRSAFKVNWDHLSISADEFEKMDEPELSREFDRNLKKLLTDLGRDRGSSDNETHDDI